MTLPEPRRLDEIRYDPLADTYIVEGLIRPNTIALLVGPSGVGKSQVRKELEHRAALGLGELLGRYAISRPLRVLTVDEDNGEDEEARRDDVLLGQLGVDRSELSGAWRISLAGFRLDEPQHREWLRGQIAAKRVELLILDPVSEMYSVDEVREKLWPLGRFLRDLLGEFPELTILLVHHPRKMPAGASTTTRTVEDVRGAVWGQIASSVMVMSPIGEERVKWEVHKRVPRSELVLEVGEAGPLHAVSELGHRPARTDDRVLAAIGAGAGTADEIMAGTGLGRSATFDAIRRLRDAELIAKSGPYRRLVR